MEFAQALVWSYNLGIEANMPNRIKAHNQNSKRPNTTTKPLIKPYQTEIADLDLEAKKYRIQSQHVLSTSF